MIPRAWKSSGSWNWLHAQLPMKHRNFSSARQNQEIWILRKIGDCSVCNASCCAAHIKTHSNDTPSMEIKRQLELVACAAPDEAQEFFICETKSRNMDFEENWRLQRLQRKLLRGTH